MLNRRSILAASVGLPLANVVRADSFPNGPFRILVPFGPGSATDQSARNIAEGLTRIFGVPAVVENKPGANGAIAADIAAKAKPDGQTIFVCSNTAAAARSMDRNSSGATHRTATCSWGCGPGLAGVR